MGPKPRVRSLFCAAGGSGENVEPGMKQSPGGCEQQQQEEEEEEEAAEAARCCLLDAVLSSLYDLGEEPVVKNEKKKIQKKNVENEIESEPTRTVMKARPACPDSAIPGKRKSASSFFEKLKNEMLHDSVDSKQGTPEASGSNSVSPESTQQGKTTEVEVVTFHGRNKKKKPEVELTQDSVSKTKMTIPEENVDGQVFNLEKARLEVHRFGITGYKKKEQRILEQDRAIMLGAKPPKKEYVNYKIYQQKIQEKKTVKKEDQSMEYKSESVKKKKKKGQEQRKFKKRKSANVLPTGQVGKFANGTLVLRGRDLRKIKLSKVVK